MPMMLGRKEWLRMLALAAAALALGLGANFLARAKLPLLRPLAPEPPAALPAAIGEVDADFVATVLSAPGTLLLDARAGEAFRAGRIPGALSLPLGEFARVFPELEPRLRQAGLLVAYCSDRTCQDSPELARRLWAQGLKNLLLFKGGMEEWREKGHEVER
jgi:rhodanese-related sulfurtransferase